MRRAPAILVDVWFSIPTGTTVHAVAVGFAAGYVLPPTNNSWATTYTVP